MKKADRIRKILLIIFYAVFSVLMLFISYVNFRYPLYYLVSWKMLVATAAFALVFFVIMIVWNKMPEKIFNSVPLFVVLSILQIALIWAVALIHGKGHLGVGDYYIVYHSAEEMAKGEPLTYYNYFMVYGNNTLPMLMLSVLIKIAGLIHVDAFYFLLALSSILVLLNFWSLRVLTKDRFEKIGIPMLVYFMLCLPVYVFSGTFYTDTFSLGVGIISIALLKVAIDEKKQYYLPFAAFFAAWGICFKITAFIPVIAAAVTYFVFGIPKIHTKKERKNALFNIIFYTLIIAVFLIGIRGVASTNSVYRDSKLKSNPLSAWIAMGMTGNGSYAGNVEFSDQINALETKAEKSELAKAYMKDNLKEALSISHIVKKAQNNFASGMFSCFDYTTPDENGSYLYKLLDPGGSLYGRSCQYTFCYVSIVYIALLFGSIKALVILIKEKDEKASELLSFPKVFADVAMFGVIIFLMLWESNNRQLYNQLPLFILILFVNSWNLIRIKKRL